MTRDGASRPSLSSPSPAKGLPLGESSSDLLAQIDSEQLHLREVLAGKPPSLLTERPPGGKWSVLENVRHLLFAEQLHLGRFVPARLAWSPLGFNPETMRRARKLTLVESEAFSVDEVLAAWGSVHAATRPFVQSDADLVRKELDRNLRHLRAHVKVIERLLRARR